MLPKEMVLQTRVTAEQMVMIKTAADAQGHTVAAYIRMAAMHFATAPLINVWVTSYGESPELWLARNYRPHYVLRRLRSAPGGEQTFTMYMITNHGELAPVPSSAVAYGIEFLKRPERHQLVLEGSQDRWFVVSTAHNAALGLVEITLRPEGSAPIDAIRKRIHDARDGELIYTLQGGGEMRGRVDILGIGVNACELRVAGGGQVTLPYANVVAVGSP